MSEPKTEKMTIAVLVLFTVVCGLLAYVLMLRRDVARLEAQAAGGIAAETGSTPAAGGVAASPAEPSPAAAGGPRSLSNSQKTALVSGLKAAVPEGGKVWFATMKSAEANAYRLVLEGVLKDAGWTIEGREVLSFPVKPGIFAFVADETPPDYVQKLLDNFESAGIQVNLGTGYRAFYAEKKKEDPSFRGVDLKPNQDFVLMIGRAP